MPEPIDWLPDGTPFSPRFSDRYHSENGGLDQARQVFLHGCGLPAAWAGQAQWRILETGFGFGLNFLVTWAAWRADAARSRSAALTGQASVEMKCSRRGRCASTRHAAQVTRKFSPKPNPVSRMRHWARPAQAAGRPQPCRKTWCA